ncbi:ABC transporter substrate-binding protein [Methylocystis parvus]|uniref:ABC transporter substrate-binding protein n=1 Tax=Methylocystis parvus TaxID=134 RepID=UPI000305221E|nr:extracellular solute-binding protein [Methylocystis parvus]WBK01190.1 extracellular solute-binding protein [Methylocystis parvus OBBP]
MRSLRPALAAPALLVFCALAPANGEERKIVVVTSFPEELTTRYEQEFEKRHPGVHVQYVWKQSRDALAELSKPEQGGADVYWAPTLANFSILRERGAFRPIKVERAVLPGKLANQRISDPDGRFEAFDVAGYGVAMNAPLAASENLAAPKRWAELARPDYARRLVMPIPAKVGFSPALYDIFLQSEGWDAGWSLLSEMASEAALLDQGALPTAQVKEGKAVFGLTIDFFAVSAKANGAPVEMIYPARTAFLPAHIAMTASSPHIDDAQAFIDFALSKDGQKLMMERDSMRHPARPDAYDEKPAALVDPFKLPSNVILDYDFEIGRRRPPLVTLLFDLAIVENHAQNAALWRAIHAAEKSAPDEARARALAEARQFMSFMPVSNVEARDVAFLGKFGSRDAIDPATIAKWREEIAASRQKARDVLAGLGVAP